MTVQWLVPPHEAERITAALHALMVAARSEPGYVRCQLSTDMGQRARLRYAEEWNGEADLQRQGFGAGEDREVVAVAQLEGTEDVGLVVHDEDRERTVVELHAASIRSCWADCKRFAGASHACKPLRWLTSGCRRWRR